ncbi:glycosyltransferase family 4 protein [Erythrobacter sp. SCSIO 43205]|uniref:glycosyltransferase family 4 protein n=1 Tax=Erythrobacter sp. SCSIO 43205 TaxID=2779361 RepID=UPI001CA9F828|nr:glycosyltransferase family 1 protein [Erythrobacter sp. SCSIO 43205]UAB77813.1 glycosyltransferase family 4 protein [Erythrobacter sp. SCSIO 43205]
MSLADIFLDVTRLVSRAWTKRRSTGIDRVCEAYCRHFQSRARAVVQHRGIVRVLDQGNSRKLFSMLLEPGENIRLEVLRFASLILPLAPSRIEGNGALYINTSHTDFDLPSHHRWVEECNLRAVYFLHDLIPLTHPRLTSAHAVKRHLGRVRGAIWHGAGVIVNTRATEMELRSFARKRALDVPPVVVAPLAGGQICQVPTQEPADAVIALDAAHDDHLALSDQTPYFVCLGTIERRKNYRMLLRVWGELAKDFGKGCPKLVIIGQEGREAREIFDAYYANRDLQDLVTFRTNATDAEAARLIKGARALLMPSHAEGYGLPVIEALQMGVPVIANDIPSFREIGQGIAFLLNINDEAGWKRAIGRFAFADDERDRQLEMMGRFEPPTWTSHFAILDPWLDRLKTVPQAQNERIEVEC